MSPRSMFAPLSADKQTAAKNHKAMSAAIKAPIIPVPEDAPPFAFRHPVFGQPTSTWAWHNADGKLVGYTLRFAHEKDGKPQKEVLPVTYCQVSEGERNYRAWRSVGVPAPRPLYRLPQLLAAAMQPVLVTEGEKKAERAAELFGDFATTTTMGGSQAPHLTDFKPLAGRRIFIWPDHDEPGREYAARAAKLALEAGASEAFIVQVPDSFPDKWDLADPLPAGVSVDDLRNLIHQAIPFELEQKDHVVRMPPGYSMEPRGLIYTDPATIDEEPEEGARTG